MKNLCITLLFCLFALMGKAADIAVCCNVNNYWSSWEQAHCVGVYGNFSGFSISYAGAQNWDWFFKFQIHNYYVPSKDEMKRYKKNDQWIEYHGTVEYYVTDKYPTIESVMRVAGTHLLPANGNDLRVKRTAKATIRIKPYKKYPKVYNIYFDGVGYGIDLMGCKWDKNQ